MKDDPSMHGFGQPIKKGDVVEIDGVVTAYFGYGVTVSKECAFYDYRNFEPSEEFFNE